MASKNILCQLIKENGNCVNLGRTLEANEPVLFSQVLTSTKFLDSKTKVKFNERVFCILNDIQEISKNFDGTEAKFVNLFQGYHFKTPPKEKISKHKKSKTEILNELKQENLKYASLVSSTCEIRGRKIKNHVTNYIKRVYTELYEKQDLIEGYDYVVCPLTKLRKTMITVEYIEQVLGLKKQVYMNIVGQNFRLTCEKRSKVISDSINKIDEKTGKTPYEVLTEKRLATMKAVDPETGLTGYQKSIAKTRNTHLSKIDENGLNGYQRLAKYRKETIMEDGNTLEFHAHQKQMDTMRKNGKTNARASKMSRDKLKKILEYIKEHNIRYYFDDTEFCVKSPDEFLTYMYDLVLPDYGVCVEYQSYAYHPDPRESDEEFLAWRPVLGTKYDANYKLTYDYKKARVLHNHIGYVTFFVWQKTASHDVEIILDYIRKLVDEKKDSGNV